MRGMDRPAENGEGAEPPASMPLIAMAASAGGLQALTRVLTHLHGDFPAPVVVLQHLSRHHPSLLAEILQRIARLTVKPASDGEQLNPGVIYCAIPDRHLLVLPGGRLSLSLDRATHFVRPSADRLFGSVAESFGARTLAVILTGTGVDGADGVRAVYSKGGTVVVQSPETAEYAGMPRAAIATKCVSHVIALDDIGPFIVDYAVNART